MSMLSRNRPLRSYYYLWRLFNSIQEEEDEIRREIKIRSYLRRNFKPLDLHEREFIKRYRLSKAAFHYICIELKNKTSLRSSIRVDLEHKVLCALSFYATGSYQRIVGMGKYLGQTTVSKYITEVTNALNNRNILSKFIKFPTNRAERDIIRQKFYTQYGFPGVLGCIDGSHFHIFSPPKDVEHLFFCRKHYYSLNVQMVCDSDGRILNINSRYGGATHDAFIWENSAVNEFMQRLDQSNEHTWLLGDSGYPQRPWLMTPITDAAENSPEAKYTSVHGRTRVVIENTFGRLKNRWRCLSKDRTLHYKPEKCARIITACSVLHNLALQFNVPDPESDSEQVSEIEDVLRPVAPEERADTGRDLLIRGRAIRTQLVRRINSLH
ncbi:putative nuclease HARBI1 [Plodia interpunctella]|uniref:putative nuclease HARBI1 n=2 Tax=Plodia interpunctella TaxID=58824 RepID=UPI002367C2E6|nr:putative nuclease HARBI1 [Plodia interpunctella]